MRTRLNKMRSALLFMAAAVIISCDQKTTNPASESDPVDMATLETEIELKLREFEANLKNGDSMALGEMYTADAIIMPSTLGRENIVKNFGSMIRDSITGSSFKTTGLWGNNQLLVEEGTGMWSHQNGEIVGRGTYLVVWIKEDGIWKIFRDSWYPEKKK